jgi:phosphatidylserine decarboxylase
MSTPDVSPELPTHTWRLLLTALRRLPQGAMSRAFGRLADVPLPPRLRRPVLGSFARAVGANLAEAELPLEAYPTLNHFFVRSLRPGAREWPRGAALLASPVDGVAGQLGRVERGRLLQAKGRWYSAADLLGDAAEAERFQGGTFLTLYLSPRHYHRIHAPCEGSISSARHVPGALLPVNAPAVAHIPELFARNERLVCYLDGPLGRVAVVAVGAYNVGRISAAFDPAWSGRGVGATPQAAWTTNRGVARPSTHRYTPPVPVAMGEEIMAFHLGSTVVMLLEAEAPPPLPRVRPGVEVRLGEPLSEPRPP